MKANYLDIHQSEAGVVGTVCRNYDGVYTNTISSIDYLDGTTCYCWYSNQSEGKFLKYIHTHGKKLGEDK